MKDCEDRAAPVRILPEWRIAASVGRPRLEPLASDLMPGLEALLTGRTLVKRYRIGEVIGRGGFAAVYRAEDERLGRPVAVKVITYPAPDADAREQLRERFQREARAAASMPQHPNVVTVHDFGTDPELGLDFLVLELLHGDNLASYLARLGRPPLDLALHILRETAEGLCIGHRAGVLHRDVKPGNVFLAAQGEAAHTRICLLDFGIAHLVEDGEASARLTRTGFAPHSPAFASPEQLRGDANLSATTDVFSLGVIGYQLLTGEKPFGDERERGAGEWIPARGIRELNPEVPEAVEEVIRRAMSYDPEDRFQDAGEMASELDRVLGTETVPFAPLIAPDTDAPAEDHTLLQAPPPAPPIAAPVRPARRAADRRRGVPLWAAVAVVVLLLGAAGVWALARGGPSLDEPIGLADDTAMIAAPPEADLGADAAERAAAAQAERPESAPGVGVEMGIVPQVESPTPLPLSDTFPSGVVVLPVDSASAAPGGAPLPVEPVTPDTLLGAGQRSQPMADSLTRDSIIPSPPPRLLGRPAHPDSARPDSPMP
jgi:tRNA A-37 threonylcarbamoyl transferase component Bud32